MIYDSLPPDANLSTAEPRKPCYTPGCAAATFTVVRFRRPESGGNAWPRSHSMRRNQSGNARTASPTLPVALGCVSGARTGLSLLAGAGTRQPDGSALRNGQGLAGPRSVRVTMRALKRW